MSANLLLLLVAEIAHRCTVGFEAVGNNPFGRSVALQRLFHEGESGSLIPAFCDVALEDLAFLFHRAPQVNHLAAQLHVHLIEVSLPMAKAAHMVDPLAADLAGEERAKPVPPQSHRLVAKIVASLEEQILDVA
jgi:hypothetical protein